MMYILQCSLSVNIKIVAPSGGSREVAFDGKEISGFLLKIVIGLM